MNDDIERRTQEAHAEALKRIRDDFQKRYPHYTPPPDASLEMWGAWLLTNVDKHGIEGFTERFPAHVQLLNTETDRDVIAGVFHTMAYPYNPRLRVEGA